MVVVAVRLAFMLGCSYGGFRIAEILNDYYALRSPYPALTVGAGIIVGILTGYVLGGIFGRYVAELFGRVEAAASRVGGAELFFGVTGALAGLLIALFPSIALFHFGYTGYIVSIVLFIVCGFIGARIGYIKRSEISTMFKMGARFGTAGAGRSPVVLDTSVIIDGRIVDMVKCGFFEGTLVVPRFVLDELQSIADSADDLKRNRGKRGLDVLNALQRLDNSSVEITDEDFPELADVDGKLMSLSKLSGMPVVTNDYNLNRVAALQGIKVFNINELASALKPVVLPGEEMRVKIIREGKEPGQGIGYLNDGTMVVVERGKDSVGSEVTVVVTSALQTPSGKMIFASLREESREVK